VSASIHAIGAKTPRLRPAIAADEFTLPPLVGDLLRRSDGSLLSERDGKELLSCQLLGRVAQLVADGTLLVACEGQRILGNAAWTFRAAPGEHGEFIRRPGIDPALLYGAQPPPSAGRHDASSLLLDRLEEDVQAAGYDSAVLVTTVDVAPRYLTRGYRVMRELDIWLQNGGFIRALRLHRRFGPALLSMV
jgi:hypothetical protein